jgi:diguanylate cyclase (GGDEF)-like protein/PAS domain S-box-containing protein
LRQTADFDQFDYFSAAIFVSTTFVTGWYIKQFQRQLIESRIAAVAFETQQGMTITDAHGTILQVNKVFSNITGYSAEEVIGKNPRLLQSGRQDSAFYKAMWEHIQRSDSWQGEVWNKRKNGEIYPEWLSISTVKDESGTVTHYVGAFTDISTRKVTEQRIESLSFYDTLTGLPNRALLRDRLQHALVVTLRRQRQAALLHIDLDNFKTINDTLGHDQGDLVLKEVVSRLRSCARASDTLARIGGDEFALLVEGPVHDDLDTMNQARVIADKVLLALRQPFALGEYAHHNSASIGITLFVGTEQVNVEEPLKQAELAMYQAKAAGRNTLRFFDPQMQATVIARAGLESRLREALELSQFVLHYQPQVDHAGQVTGSEVLLRWLDPKRGMVSPAEFIPVAEQSGLILPLGQWVLETACNELVRWASNPLMADLTAAVNVSARQFQQNTFVDDVLDTLKRTGADPKHLKLELTESMLVNDIEGVIVKMRALKGYGVNFSLDDFGTGYSSLAYLKRLPLYQLKIDQSFVRDILVDANDAAIARMVIALAISMGLAVIAEGVETEGQRDYLSKEGCQAYQGYLFSKPLPLAEFEAFVKKGPSLRP